MTHDVLVLGGGTAGLTAARSARLQGAHTVLVDRQPRLGGECTFVGCVPSKTLIEAARVLWSIRHAERIGIHVDGVRLDFAALMRHKDRVIDDINRDESDSSMEEAGIEIARGEATFTSPHTVRVGQDELRFERVVLCQGSDPAVPPVPGLDGVAYLTNESVFSLETLPRRLLVLGAGPIGLEMAQCFHRLGSEVTVVGRGLQCLPKEDPEVGVVVRRFLEREGVELLLGSEPTAVREEGAEIVVDVTLPDGGSRSLRGDRLLVATGRRPRTAGLGLEALGLDPDPGGIRVDERCRTSVEHVFAAGDVTGGYQFTHWAAHQGRVAGANAAGKRQKTSDRVLPWVTFLDPEVARVGLTEPEARERHGGAVEVARFPFSRIDRARTMLETEGFIKLIVTKPPLIGDATGGQVVGCHIVGVHAGEMIHEVVVSMQAKTFAGRLAQAIHAYPTLALGVQQAAAQLFAGGRALSEAEPLDPIVS